MDKSRSNKNKPDLLARAIAEAIGVLGPYTIITKSAQPEPSTQTDSCFKVPKFLEQVCRPKQNISVERNDRKRSLSTDVAEHRKPNSTVRHSSSSSLTSIASSTSTLSITSPTISPSLPLSYELIKLFRKHSRKSETNDTKTPVWDIKFRPISHRYSDNHIVATCGGNIVNLIDLKTSCVYQRYEDKNSSETFNCVVWRDFTIINRHQKRIDLTIVCVGGTKKEHKYTNIVFINADNTGDHLHVSAHYQSVNTLLFHPTKRDHLFSGGYDKKIVIWALDWSKVSGSSTLALLTVKRITEIEFQNRILSIALAKKLELLVIAGEDGIQVMKDPTSPGIDRRVYRVELPEKKQFVDGLALVEDNAANLMAFRYNQRIIVADLDKMVPEIRIRNCNCVLKLSIVTQLRHCRHKCDYFYMSLESRLLCCGDAVGQILVYYLKDSSLKRAVQQKENQMEPIRVLPMPQLNNVSINNQLVLKPTDNKVFINIAAISPNHEYIVSGTNTNLICVWRKCRINTSQASKKVKTVIAL